MKQRSSEKITLIGAGLAGSLLTIFLAKRGYRVEVYERRSDMRKTKISAGRSINLALSTRGIHALQQVGLYDEITPLIVPMRGRMIHSIKGELMFQPYGKDETEVINSVSRAELNKKLMSAAEGYDGVRIHFNRKCTGMNFKTGELQLRHQATGEKQSLRAERVIGTDGSASAIRNSMLKIGRFSFSQDYLEHGYKELTIPAGPNGEFMLEKNALHIWPRGTYMLIALPNLEGSFTCTLFLPFEGENSFTNLTSEKIVVEFFEKQFPDAVPLLPNLRGEFFSNPTGSMVTIKCFPWHVADKALLLGDAAHAIVPFFGQGMNCAFEDCTYLDQCIEEHHPHWESVFQAYEKRRKENTDAIADMAFTNFIEMRDRVADPKFLLQKQVEIELERKYPEAFLPEYSMVSFHRVPYSAALRKGKIQEKILQELCATIDRIEEVNWKKADRLIRSNLSGVE